MFLMSVFFLTCVFSVPFTVMTMRDIFYFRPPPSSHITVHAQCLPGSTLSTVRWGIAVPLSFQAAVTKHHGLGGLLKTDLYFQGSGDRMSEIRVPVRLVLVRESCLPSCRLWTSSQVLTGEGSPFRALISVTRAPPS